MGTDLITENAAPKPALKLDFLIPASPHDGFYSQIAFFRLALDQLGGIYKEARLVAVFGDDRPRPLPARWAPFFDRIDVEWADPKEFKRRGYFAQGLRRFEVFRPDADLVILCDADTVLMRGLGWLIAEMVLRPALAGVIAHFHFPWENGTGNAASDWQCLAGIVLGREIALPYFYSLTEAGEQQRCPFCINYGFFAGPASMLRTFYRCYLDMLPAVHAVLKNYFAGQVALALAAEDLGLPMLALPMRYNFPNDPLADDRYHLEKHIIILFHYLRTAKFDRQIIFTNPKDFDLFLSRRLTGSNHIFQEFVESLTGGRFPFDTARPDIGEAGRS